MIDRMTKATFNDIDFQYQEMAKIKNISKIKKRRISRRGRDFGINHQIRHMDPFGIDLYDYFRMEEK
jgi:hypothetical protein